MKLHLMRLAPGLPLVLAIALPGTANALPNCPGTEGYDVRVRVERTVTVTWDTGRKCALRPGRKLEVNAGCGCKNGRLDCDVVFPGEHYHSGAFPEVTGGKCNIRRANRCKPYHKADCD